MRIGIDARLLGGQYTGDRTYWRGLISGLALIDQKNSYILYHREEIAAESRISLPVNFQYRHVPSRSDRSWSLVELPNAAKADITDLIHVQYTVSPLFTMPVVTTIHDITFRLFPKLFAFKDRLLLNLTVPLAIRKAAHILTVSESTKRDILKQYHGVEPSRITATYLSVGGDYQPLDMDAKAEARQMLAEIYPLGDCPYVVAVGVLQPRKNLPLLIHAFLKAKFLAALPQKLVIVGKKGWLTKEIDAVLGQSMEDSVVFTGYVPDEHVTMLYQCADLCVYPSLYEGFGLPPLEAMACGCPVLSSNTSSLPEVVGDGGKLISPRDQGAWIDSLVEILTSPSLRENMTQRGLDQAKKFDWRRTAEQTLEVYQSVVST